MASHPSMRRLLPRASRHLAIPRTAARRTLFPSRTTLPQPPAPLHLSTPVSRPFSSTSLRREQEASSDSPSEIHAYDFHTLSTLVSNPSPSTVIIDVREPGELQQSGRVPGAQNVPINSAPDGLFLPAEEFEDRFGFEKPAADTEVVFYCKAGVRSRAAARVARMAGWRKVGEYPGSWLDWEKNGGVVEK